MLMRFIVVTLITVLATLVNAQAYDELALRFSRNQFQGGTARYLGVAGNFSAVGPDIGNIGVNPAATGMMRSSVFNFSLGSDYNKQTIDYLNTATSNDRFNLNLSSLGVSFNSDKGKTPLTFAIAYNRHNSFQFERSYSGTNKWNSISDFYAEEGNQNLDLGPDGIGTIEDNGYPAYVTPETWSAWWGYILNWDSASNSYLTPITGAVNQSFEQEVRGSKSEIDISLGGGNITKKLFIGATLGVPIIRYQSSITYQEEDAQNTNPLFNNLEETRVFQSNGAGLNLKLGVIGRPTSWLRIGAAIHTPSVLSLEESWSHRTSTSVDTALTLSNFCQPCDEFSGSFDYRLRMPWRANAGFAFFFKKYGFVSLQYDVVDYGSMRYNFSEEFRSTETEINKQIQNKYTFAHRAGIGLEGAFDKFRVRLGYAFLSSPFQSGVGVENYNYASHTATGGLGIVLDRWAFDLGYARTMFNQYSEFYQLADDGGQAPGAFEKTVMNNAVLTVAYKLR